MSETPTKGRGFSRAPSPEPLSELLTQRSARLPDLPPDYIDNLMFRLFDCIERDLRELERLQSLSGSDPRKEMEDRLALLTKYYGICKLEREARHEWRQFRKWQRKWKKKRDPRGAVKA